MARHKASRPHLGSKCRLTYATAYTNRRRQPDTAAFQRNPISRVCHGIRHTTDSRRSALPGTEMPTYVSHGIHKPRKTARHNHVPARFDSLRMPRHTPHNRQKTPHAIRKLQYQLTYAPTYVTRQMEGVTHYPGTIMPTYVCPGIRYAPGRSLPAPPRSRNADLRTPRHTGRRGNQSSNPDSPTPTPDTHIRR